MPLVIHMDSKFMQAIVYNADGVLSDVDDGIDNDCNPPPKNSDDEYIVNMTCNYNDTPYASS